MDDIGLWTTLGMALMCGMDCTETFHMIEEGDLFSTKEILWSNWASGRVSSLDDGGSRDLFNRSVLQGSMSGYHKLLIISEKEAHGQLIPWNYVHIMHSDFSDLGPKYIEILPWMNITECKESSSNGEITKLWARDSRPGLCLLLYYFFSSAV